MKQLYDIFSFKISKIITNHYSTSFSLATSFFPKKIKYAIYSIYGFVRLADEIVDSFLNYNQKELFDNFLEQLNFTFKHGISTNPILNSFYLTVKEYEIPQDLIDAFLKSMQADLYKLTYDDEQELKNYIYGSADVVGLMCLKVFTHNKPELYEKLIIPARALGSAFQKVNFLRDLQYDTNTLGREYFKDFVKLSANDKNKIYSVIDKEFITALEGIRKLPYDCQLPVYIAFVYYLKLYQKIKKYYLKHNQAKRIRINNGIKFLLISTSYLKHKFKLI